MTNSRARIIWTLFAVVVIAAGTLVAIRFAQGYRPSRTQFLAERGLLVTNSTPQGARVVVDDRFLTATDDTISLDPGEYDVQIMKDGYWPWRKRLKVEKELVTQANALLFPVAPSLSPLTFSGASHLTPSPDGQRLIMHTASASAATGNGFFALELSDNPLAFQRGARQILTESEFFPAESTQIVWSPDSSQVIFASPRKAIILDPTRSNNPATLPDITFQLPTILSQWEEEMYRRDRQRLALFPVEVQNFINQNGVNVYFSPDEEKILFTATAAAALTENILPEKPASSTQEQQRSTEEGGIYVYDREEDRQFRVGTDTQYLENKQKITQGSDAATQVVLPGVRPDSEATNSAVIYQAQKKLLADDLITNRQPLSLAASPSAFTRLQVPGEIEKTLENFRTYHSPLFSHGVQWFPNSSHLISSDGTTISLMEADGTNVVRVYSGPFTDNFVYPWPNGSRLIILANFQVEVPPNLYTVVLR